MLPNYSKTASVTVKSLMQTNRPVEVVGCHSPLSAKLAEAAGFPAVWLSSLELSSVSGLPDANFLSMAENLEMIRRICLSVSVPVIADCDSGYGNEVNVYRMVQLYEQAGVSAISIEDNVFPKKCSFYEGGSDELVSVEEHARKVKAACKGRKSKDFFIIARTEAFIRNLGLEEALKRAHAYADAGADAIFVHSKKKTDEDIVAFTKVWNRDVPLVCSPTTYNQYTSAELLERGYSMIIYANQGLRATVRALQETYAHIKEKGSTKGLDGVIAPLQDVFNVAGVAEMEELISSLQQPT